MQVGQDEGLQFCHPGRSAFEGVFQDPSNDPKLLILAFLGNGAGRWAENQSLADKDVRDTMAQIPADLPCIFLTTVPVFETETNDLRMRAQTNVLRSFAKYGQQCEIVKGFGRHTRRAIEGKKRFFRLDDEGNIADPLHPNKAAAEAFVRLNRSKLCKAITRALKTRP